MNDLSVILVTYNNESTITECIQSIRKNLGNQVEIIVVDNDSHDKTVQIVRSLNCYIYEVHKNLGFSAANNIGVGIAGNSNLLFLNPDVTLNMDVSGIYKHLNDSVGLVTGKIKNVDGSLQASCYNFENPINIICAVFAVGKFLPEIIREKRFFRWSSHRKCMTPDWVMGSFMCMKKDVFLEIGGFSEDYFLYAEDMDICYKLYLNGYRIKYFPNYSITHIGGVSEKQLSSGDKFKKIRKTVASSSIFAKKYGLDWNIRIFILAHFVRKTILKFIAIFCKNHVLNIQDKIKQDEVYIRCYRENI